MRRKSLLIMSVISRGNHICCYHIIFLSWFFVPTQPTHIKVNVYIKTFSFITVHKITTEKISVSPLDRVKVAESHLSDYWVNCHKSKYLPNTCSRGKFKSHQILLRCWKTNRLEQFLSQLHLFQFIILGAELGRGLRQFFRNLV